ncbi:hypothetical protein LC612_35275 [Nostoc sp. CHAB 5834]|nr:hypothetical protein [Nostoc sp. CHAB 5834]
MVQQTETNGVVVKLAIAPNNPQMLYAVNENNTVFQSQNEGNSYLFVVNCNIQRQDSAEFPVTNALHSTHQMCVFVPQPDV